MPEHDAEILEVVDSQDRVIGLAPRSVIHRKGFMHRAVHVFVFDPEGRIYVQRRSWHKDRHAGLLDSSAAGHVDPCEPYHVAAARELSEELGLSGSLREILHLSASEITDQEHLKLYEFLTTVTPAPNPEEIQSGEFVTPSVLNARMQADPGDFVPVFVHLWERYRSLQE